MSTKGGARHTTKPQVDTGLLYKAMSSHRQLLANMGLYESISKTQACNPKALVKVMPLIKGLVELEATAEIHGQNLRQAIFQLLMEDPSLNESKWAGGTWVSLRVERLNVVLFHMRRLRLSGDLRACASKLTTAEFLQVQDVVELMEKKPDLQDVLPLAQREEPSPLAEREKPKEPDKAAKKLKVSTSDVSVDSHGPPNMFGTPDPSAAASPASSKPLPKGEPHEENSLPKGSEPSESNSLPKGKESTLAKPIAQPSFLRRRLGQQATKTDQAKEQNLRKELGFVAAMKRPAKKMAKAKNKAKSKKPLPKGHGSTPTYPRKEWTKLRVTKSSKEPLTAYITGTTETGGKGKLSLIVETTHKNHPKYLEILEHIKEKLEKDHLTKVEAVELRQHCYQTWQQAIYAYTLPKGAVHKPQPIAKRGICRNP